MISKVGYDSHIITDHSQLKKPSLIIIPGVGNFSNVMKNFKLKFDLEELKNEINEQKIPVLGICVGMQIMGSFSEEGNCKGLGWMDFNVKKIDIDQNEFSLPHMGWGILKQVNKNAFFTKINQRFYFVHSYFCDVKDRSIILNEVLYGNTSIVSSFSYQNITGVQFHPEKSHKFGEEFFKNYLKYYL